LARKFLYVIAVLIVLAVAARLAYTFFGADLMRMGMVPSAQFEAEPSLAANAYADPKMWFARPDMPDNPALWTPAGYKPGAAPQAAVFFIHPTSYLDRSHWNAPLDNKEANDRAALFLRGQASAFNDSGLIWAPRYRQATFGAFLTSEKSANEALDLAYHDIEQAFAQFLKEAGDRPIILAGHSQGALHLTRLLREHVTDTPLAKRIVAAYVIGWPISKTADLPALGLPECATPDQTGCILSWQSFAEPADPSLILDTFDASTGFTGAARKGTAMICTNPLTGAAGGAAPASANLGTLTPSADLSSATIAAGQVGAQCDGRGLLMIGAPIDLGAYVLPGNNYHVYDYSLFWANVRADAARRLAAFRKK
jgi:pimeloyl-ACP methyl ester carboxylesterase